LRGLATAAIDVSDGLTGDLDHIAEASEVGARIELGKVPRSPALDRLLVGDDRAVALECLLAGGDDYELCFTASPAAAAKLQAVAAETGVALTRIGTIAAQRGLIVLDERGRPLPPPRAFDHFRG
jgi:thiamine-monophosphate kinase